MWYVYESGLLAWIWCEKDKPSQEYFKTFGFFYDGEAFPAKVRYDVMVITPEGYNEKRPAWPIGYKFHADDIVKQVDDNWVTTNKTCYPIDTLIEDRKWNHVKTVQGNCPHCGSIKQKKKFDWGFKREYWGCSDCGKDY